MILEKQPELLADAIRAASEYYHIAPVYIEKDYWISKILQQLSIIRKTKCFDFWERNVLFPKTKRSFFRTPTLPFST